MNLIVIIVFTNVRTHVQSRIHKSIQQKYIYYIPHLMCLFIELMLLYLFLVLTLLFFTHLVHFVLFTSTKTLVYRGRGERECD